VGQRVDGSVQLVVRRLADDLPHGAAVWRQRPSVDGSVELVVRRLAGDLSHSAAV